MPLVSSDARADEPTLARFVRRLDDATAQSNGWRARCPAHEDRSPSLSIGLGGVGQIVLHCHAGCPPASIVTALGLTMADLFVAPPVQSRRRTIVATYDYRDETGALLFQACRYEPKDFRSRRPIGSAWAWNLTGVRRVPYRLPELLAADPSAIVLIVEGEKDTDRLAGLGFVATTNVGGAGKWRPEYGEPLRDRRIVILPDNDEPGRAHAAAVATSLAGIAASVAIVELPGLPPKGDISDWLDRGGEVAVLHRLIAAESVPGREATAEPTEIDADWAATLDAVVAHLRRFVHFARPEDAIAVALWVAHTHVPLARLEQSPILALTSAMKQSGKTKLLDLLEYLVARPWRITRPSEAVLYRKIDQDHPTVLLDEIDTIFADKAGSTEGIRAIFNAGNRRGTKVPRVTPQGKAFALVEFDVFCPKATAGIGGLPDTILDRAIVVTMERRARGEPLVRLRERTARRLGTPLRDQLARLGAGMTDLTLADAELPVELDDRAQDGWEPLLAIAAAAGGDWPARARAAAIAIHIRRVAIDDSYPARLLSDCREAFAEGGATFVPTAELVRRLVAIEGAPWGDLRGRPISAHYLARHLGAFGIGPRQDRPAEGGGAVRGYRRADFSDAWARYVTPSPQATGTTGTSGTDEPPSARSDSDAVPVVPLVPLSWQTSSDVGRRLGAGGSAPPKTTVPAAVADPGADEITLWTE
jgi:hypothetical protein